MCKWVRLALIPVLILIPSLRGETASACLTGVITDQTDSPIPLAQVWAVNSGTGFTRIGHSDESGYFTLPLLQPGTYRLTVQKEGLKPIAWPGVVLRHGRTTRIDFVMSVTPMVTSIEVSDGEPSVDRAGIWPSSSLSGQEIVELPVSFASGRAVMDVVMLNPGLTSQQGLYSNANYSINGSPHNTQHIAVDGMRINVPGSDTWYRLRPALEEVGEVRIQSGAYAADEGGLAAISIVTRPGTNDFHGSAWYFFANERLRARNFFQSNKPDFDNREYGASLSGPLFRNRTFFSFSYDQYRSRKPQGPITTVPTKALREGNFQGVAEIFDPQTARSAPNGAGIVRDPFPAATIPQSRMDRVSIAMLRYLPLPTAPNTLVNNYNSQLIPDSAFNQLIDAANLRMDQKVTSGNQLFVRFERFGGGYRAEKTFPGDADLTGQRHDAPAHILTIGDSQSFGASVVNEFRSGFTNTGSKSRYAAYNRDAAAALGLKNVSPLHFPVVSIGGVVPVRFGPRGSNDESAALTRDLSDSLTAVRGRHTVKAGLAYRQERLDTYSAGTPSGSFVFSGIFSNQPELAGVGAGFADFLLGLPSSTTLTAGIPFAYEKHSWAVFLQDEVKLGRNLTLNVGLRYEIPSGVRELRDRMSNFSPTTWNPVTGTLGALVFAGRDAPRRLAATDTNNLSPRIGLAYSWDRKTVVRTGYAINYYADRLAYQQGSSLGFVPSLTIATTDQVTPLVQLQDGPPLLGPAPGPGAQIANNNNLVYIPRQMPAVTFYQWSAGIEREAPGRIFLQASYIGSRGSHLWFPRDINQVPGMLLGPGDAQPRRPFPQFFSINFRGVDGFSKYHGLQLAAARRFTGAFTFSANYTLSKTLDNTSFDNAGSAPVQNVYDLRSEYGLSDHDNPHVFNMSVAYQIPRLAKGRMGTLLTSGWQLNAIAHLQAGFPFNVTTSINQSGALSGVLRPDRLEDGRLPPNQRTVERWFDAGAFSLPAPYHFGNSGRNILRQPGFRQLDFSLTRNLDFRTHFSENTRVQIRVELFNLLNHVNFEAPDGRIGSRTAGTISKAKDPRMTTLALRLFF